MKRLAPALILFCVLITLLIFFIYFGLERIRLDKGPALLTVTYLNVGQGDATFIESPQGMQILIDGGRDTSVLRQLPKVMGYFDRTIDMVVATHPDADHIGGLIDVLKRYSVESILMTDNINDTPAYETFLDAVEKEDTMVLYAKRGQVFDLGMGPSGSTTLTILFPDRDVRDLESNTSSIITKLSYGDADFMFTGDSPVAIESYLVGLDSSVLESEVLKAGHHGSRTSTSEVFVSAVQPLYGIISAGKDNEYGHPHTEVMETFRAHGVETKNTADVGSIFVESDGQKIWFK
jgi:competence protein ComEC